MFLCLGGFPLFFLHGLFVCSLRVFVRSLFQRLFPFSFVFQTLPKNNKQNFVVLDFTPPLESFGVSLFHPVFDTSFYHPFGFRVRSDVHLVRELLKTRRRTQEVISSYQRLLYSLLSHEKSYTTGHISNLSSSNV